LQLENLCIVFRKNCQNDTRVLLMVLIISTALINRLITTALITRLITTALITNKKQLQ
jgi:hypothetical protein